MSPRTPPTRAIEHELIASGATSVAFVDECGRGSAAGPLIVCAATIPDGAPPTGLADSKLLSPRARERLEPLLLSWVTDHSFGHATAEEIDALGMAACLTLAAHRALAGLTTPFDAVILDGPHDYIREPYTVTARAKADLTEIGVAAASTLGKEHRDRLMRTLALEVPGYELERNAGYLSAAHRDALERLGPSTHHRTTWKFMDPLPQWEHLRRSPATEPQAGPTLPA